MTAMQCSHHVVVSGASSFLHYLVQGAAYLTAATVVGGSFLWLWELGQRTVFRRSAVARIVESLTTTVQINFISDLIGRPATFRQLQPDGLTENIFVTDFCYVQTLSNGDGTVQRLAITSIHPRFHPRFRLGLPGSIPNIHVRLGRTRFNQVALPGIWGVSLGARRFRYWESYYLGNPGGYQTFVLAFSDAARTVPGQVSRILPEATGANGGATTALAFTTSHGSTTTREDWELFRSETVINTFGLAIGNIDVNLWAIGADLDTVRLLPPPKRRRRLIERAARNLN